MLLGLPPGFQHQSSICEGKTDFSKPYSSRASVYRWRWVHDDHLEKVKRYKKLRLRFSHVTVVFNNITYTEA